MSGRRAPSPWVQWACSRLLEAADLGGYTLTKRKVSPHGSVYMRLSHAARPALWVRVSMAQGAQGWADHPGRTIQAFTVYRARTLAHLVKVISRGRLSLTTGPSRDAPACSYSQPEAALSRVSVGEADAFKRSDAAAWGRVLPTSAPTARPEPPLCCASVPPVTSGDHGGG